MALRLDKGTDLVLNTHLQPSGKPEVIQPSIGLYFTPHAATKLPMLLQLENDAKLDIPPGQKDFLLTDEFTLPIDVELMAIYPHAHYLGKDMQALATLPDGTQENADPHSAMEFELAGGVSLRSSRCGCPRERR